MTERRSACLQHHEAIRENSLQLQTLLIKHKEQEETAQKLFDTLNLVSSQFDFLNAKTIRIEATVERIDQRLHDDWLREKAVKEFKRKVSKAAAATVSAVGVIIGIVAKIKGWV